MARRLSSIAALTNTCRAPVKWPPTTPHRLLCTPRHTSRINSKPTASLTIGGLLLQQTSFATNSHTTDNSDEPPVDDESTQQQQDPLTVIKEIVHSNPIILFMKGTPEEPQCGFSKQAVDAINAADVSEFAYVNVLEYPVIREKIKLYSNWPTIPQLYVSGEFVGGCDVMMEMHNDGSLKSLLHSAAVPS